ncbi:MAG: hypothetical protein AAGF98_19360, partial [Cyanobacteria bacterium P01_H01_bin.153]
MRLKVGSLPWLLRHEIRLWWRELRGKWLILALALLFGLPYMLLLVLSLSLQSADSGSSGSIAQTLGITPLADPVLWGAVLVCFFIFYLAFMQAIPKSLTAVFDRGDLDLLIASPVSGKTVFASRLIGVSLQIFLGIGVFLVLPSLFALVLGLFQVLGIYIALAGICLVATSLAMVITLWLVHLMGAPKARVTSQILASVLGLSFFLMTQLPNLIGPAVEDTGVWNTLLGIFEGEDAILGANSWLWFPARAIFLDPGAALLTVLVSVAIPWLTIAMLYRTFVESTQQSFTAKRRKSAASVTQFKSKLSRVVLSKEWRIIRRNPYLLSRTALSVLFLIPIAVSLLRGGGDTAIAAPNTLVASAGPVVGISLTSQLALICIAGEEASDLLRSAPVEGTTLRRLKLLAVLLPVWLLLSPLFFTLMLRGEPWLPALAVFLGATTCHALLSLWSAR